MAGRRRPTPLRDRARYRFDSTLARSTGVLLGWLSACCLCVVVPVSALLVWTDPSSPHTFTGRLVIVWRTSAETLRLNGVTGAPLRMLLSALLGVIALLCVSTLIGVITTGLGDRLTELRRGRSTVLERQHAVVLGWSDQVFTVVGELLAARTGRSREVVAVLAHRDPAEMDESLRAALALPGGARLVCRTGSPSDPRALEVVAPHAAGSVLVLPVEDPDADPQVVRALLALRALLGRQPGPPVVAAVRDARYLPAARLAAGPRGTVLETELTTARLLVQSARRPGLPAALRDLLDFAGAEFHVRDATALAGLTFKDAALHLDDAAVVGLLPPEGRPTLTPPAETVVTATDRLIVVAHDDSAAASADLRAHVDPTAVAPPVPRTEGPVRTLLLGWNRRAPLIVHILRATARTGSTLDILTGPHPDPEPIPPSESLSSGRLDTTFHPGDPVRPEVLRALDLFGYDSVLVLGPDAHTGPEQPDDRTLLTLLMLRSIEEEHGRALPVVAELSDPRSRPLAPLGPAADVVVRGELTALLMTQISHNPPLAPVFEEVFATRGGALALYPVGDYLRPGREASFATVVAAALARGECAIGYRPGSADPVLRDHGVRLAPRTSERRTWNAADEILVLTRPEPPSEPGGGSEISARTETGAESLTGSETGPESLTGTEIGSETSTVTGTGTEPRPAPQSASAAEPFAGTDAPNPLPGMRRGQDGGGSPAVTPEDDRRTP
ncbi:CASTOR/POLLUX-related putative ion channel [Streptomyces griseoviridis]|uniref:CASTOR/POLLUX-related putative ion channel n=1 Tax=Streptomyces griseoviridis TaxID=45398 RepID=UPI001F0B920D|nr:NAD-binding lipoprotein [Streptomyces griseoviridis]